MNVNIGTTNTSYVSDVNHSLFAGTSWAGCVLERAPPNHITTNYSPGMKWQAYINPPETSNSACVNRGNGTNAGYGQVDPNIPGSYSALTKGPNYNCVRHPMRALSSDANTVKSQIDTLTAEFNDGTILSPGVTWAARLLTPDAPFPGADPFSAGVKKILVMLTDGAQTTEKRGTDCNDTTNGWGTPYSFDPSRFKLAGRAVGPRGPRDFFGPYGYLYDSDPLGYGYTSYSQVDSSLDRLAISTCDYVKGLGIEIFSVAVSASAGPGTSVYDTLRNCASDPQHFFHATDEAGMRAAFATIAREGAKFARTK